MEIMVGRFRVAVEVVPPTPQTLSHRYDALAPRWHHTIRRLGFQRGYDALFARWRFPKISPMQVLDVGIGSGGLSEALLNHAPAPVHLTGVDISKRMLIEAERNLRPFTPKLTLHQRNVEQLGCKNDAFDLVMSAHVLEHLQEIELGLKEMVRVTKPGGTLLLIMTRKSVGASWLHLLWQLHTLPQPQLFTLMAQTKLTNLHSIRFPTPPWTNWMSMALVGKKVGGRGAGSGDQ